MNAMLFLVRKQFKNTLLEMLHHPAKLIVYLILAAIIIFSLVTMAMEPELFAQKQDIRMLGGIYLAFLLLIGTISLLTALKSGATFFKMGDVSYLFVSPISPRRILFYGLTKQMMVSLLSMVFMVCYAPMLMQYFPISGAEFAALLVGLIVMIFCVQFLSVLIYSFTNSHPTRVRVVKGIIYGILAAAVVYVGSYVMENGSSTESFLEAISARVLEFIPIMGWIKGAVFAVIDGNGLMLAVFGGLTVLLVALSMFLFFKSRPDYYEDVLQSTETTHQMQQAAKEGDIMAASNLTPRKIRVKDVGIGHGWGANAFFFKHVRELKRRSPLIFLNTSTVLLLLVNLVMAFFMKNVGDEMTPGVILISCLCASAYIQFFLTAAGDWAKELKRPYLYLAPLPPFQKLIWACATSMLKPAVDGVVIFLAVGIFIGANPLTVLCCILGYASFGVMLTAGDVLCQRIFGQSGNKGLLMMVYILILLLLMMPGLVVSILLLIFAGDILPAILIGLPVIVWNLLVSVLAFAIGRNFLANAEYLK